MALFENLASLSLIIAVTIAFLSFVAIIFYARLQKHSRILEKASKDKPSPQDGQDVIIVGAGVIGSPLATVLARDGRRVTIIERSMKPPDRIVGELMLAGGMKAMSELNIDVSADDVKGIMVDKMVMYSTLDCPVIFPMASSCMNAVNGNFVDALRKLALAEERCRIIEGNVTHLCMENGVVTGIEYQEKTSGETKVLKAALTILADGSNSRLRTVNIPRKATHCNYNIALEAETKTDSSLSVVPTSLGAWAMVGIEPEKLRFMLNTNKKWKLTDLQKIVSEFPDCFKEAFKNATKTSTIRTVPVYYLPPSMKHVPGVITIGDALSIRNAIGASGMMVGMRDVVTWRSLLRGIPDLYNYEAMFAAENIFASKRKNYCFVTDLVGWCLWHFFLPETDGLKLIGATFGDYITTIKADYMNLFTGVDTRAHVLLYHLGKVTMLTMWKAIRGNGWSGLPHGIYQAVQAFCSAFATIIPHVLCQIKSSIVTK